MWRSGDLAAGTPALRVFQPFFSMMAAIETTNLTKQYGSTVAVDGLDLSIDTGEVFGFLGPNGAGKSTTINLLLNFTHPTSGSAHVFGHDIVEESQAVRRRTGVLADGIDLYGRLTGRRHLELAIAWADGTESVSSLLERVSLDKTAAEQPVSGYSKGMKQRLALAMALAGDPDLLILDEPASGLDPIGIRLLRDLVREEADRGTTVFFSSHDLGQVEAVCDRIGILAEGSLVAVDTASGLRDAIGASGELQLRLPTEPRIAIDRINGVQHATFNDGILSVTCADPEAKAQVIYYLIDDGHVINDVDAEPAALEDVFTAYTSGSLAHAEPSRSQPPTPEMEVTL